MVEPHCSNFSIITAIFWVSEYLGILRYQTDSHTFLWLTNFIRTNSLYARLACVTFWNGRLSFLIATLVSVALSYAALERKRKTRVNKHVNRNYVLVELTCWAQLFKTNDVIS